MNSKLKTQNSKLKILGVINGKTLFTLLITLVAAYCSLFTVQAQRRDHLTAEEIELVRDAQQIDHRMEVFVKAIDRRFSVLNNAAPTKKPEKDADKWGELPTGTRQQLLTDIEKLLDEAISKIDDVAARDMKSDFFPNAVHTLADGANRFLPQLKSQMDKTTDEKERGAIIGAIDFCNQIIEASAKVKRETPKEIKKRKEKETKNQSKPN
ncbi:MAG TPA: hypothetical protein VK308_08985 [Pyrinomonadaceae bacterium]|nr:hypothetical protein [Pyrinomonadaceae bacterium]